ncbi:MAG: LamG domain-containing protein [Myxococcales bacterium]|nr:LamG domain-containing protein [Myxococcales bacterium]
MARSNLSYVTRGRGALLGLGLSLALAALGACGDNGVGFEGGDSDAGPDAAADAAADVDADADAGPDAPGACDDGEFRCAGDNLETCKADRSGFQPVATCLPGLCDAPGKQCDNCVPGAGTCDSSGSGYSACDATGQTQEKVSCSAPKPFCVAVSGAPACVECKAQTDCPPSTAQCQVSSCSVSGSCGVSPVVKDAPCGASGAGGKCDGAGACVYCQPGQKRCSGAVPEACDAKGQWVAGNSCAGAAPVCAQGDCVQCQAPSDCPATVNECLSVTCASAQCGLSPKSQGTTCAAGAGTCDGSGQCNVCQPGTKACNGNVPLVCGSNGQYSAQPACSGATPNCAPTTGTCVQCTSATQCPGTTAPCLQAVCASNTCGFGNKGDGTACTVSGDNGACAAGSCKVCTVGQTRCKAGSASTLQTCDSNGQWQDSACAASTPYCSGGTCVALNAMKLSSAAATVSVPSTGFALAGGPFTFETWLKVHDEFPRDPNSSFIFATNESQTNWFSLLLNANGGLGPMYQQSPSFCSFAPASKSIADGQWHHVAVTRSGNASTLFIDGVADLVDNLTWYGCACAANGQPTVCLSGSAPARFGAIGSLKAAPVSLGRVRLSSTARYTGSFTPAKSWALDASTVAQWIVSQPFLGATLVDEAGGQNTSTSLLAVVPVAEP